MTRETARGTARTPFDFEAHLRRQREFSERTFGPGRRTSGLCEHIRKELTEIAAAPSDISEWIDVTILALDGAWRAGYTPDQIISALVSKQTKNEGRKWPDWRLATEGQAIEHDRTQDRGTAIEDAPRPPSAEHLMNLVREFGSVETNTEIRKRAQRGGQ